MLVAPLLSRFQEDLFFVVAYTALIVLFIIAYVILRELWKRR